MKFKHQSMETGNYKPRVPVLLIWYLFVVYFFKPNRFFQRPMLLLCSLSLLDILKHIFETKKESKNNFNVSFDSQVFLLLQFTAVTWKFQTLFISYLKPKQWKYPSHKLSLLSNIKKPSSPSRGQAYIGEEMLWNPLTLHWTFNSAAYDISITYSGYGKPEEYLQFLTNV